MSRNHRSEEHTRAIVDRCMLAIERAEDLFVESVMTRNGIEHRAGLAARCIGVTDTAATFVSRGGVVWIALDAIVRLAPLPTTADAETGR